MINFLTDYVKTTITSISSISFGLCLDITPTQITTNILQQVSLSLGCIVGMFAIINGIYKLIENIKKFLINL